MEDPQADPGSEESGSPSKLFMEALRRTASLRRRRVTIDGAVDARVALAASAAVADSAPSPRRALAPAPPQGPPPATARQHRQASRIRSGNRAKSSKSGGQSDALSAGELGSAVCVSLDTPAIVATSGKAVASVVAMETKHAGIAEPTSHGKSGPAAPAFLDPRIERMHFLHAVQRMRSQVAARSDRAASAAGYVSSTDPGGCGGIASGYGAVATQACDPFPRPHSAAARLHTAADEEL